MLWGPRTAVEFVVGRAGLAGAAADRRVIQPVV